MSSDSPRAHSATKKARQSPILRGIAIFVLIVLLGTVGAYGYFVGPSANTIADGVSVGDIDMSGLSSAQAATQLQTSLTNFQLTYAGDTAQFINPINNSSAPLPIIFNTPQTISRAMAVGHTGNALRVLGEQIEAKLFGRNIPPTYSFDRTALASVLTAQFAKQLSKDFSPPVNAEFAISFPELGSPVVSFTEGSPGTVINSTIALRDTITRLNTFQNTPINLSFIAEQPTITTADLAPLVSEVGVALGRVPLTLTAQTESWTFDRLALASMLTVKNKRLGLDPKKFQTYLTKRTVNLSINPVNAIFIEKNGKVSQFQPGIPGTQISASASMAMIENALFVAPTSSTTPSPPSSSSTPVTLNLPTTSVQPTIDTVDANPYGITEIIGVGSSNFKGSPVNRRKNITVGAASVNGTLVQPDAEFSLLNTLGKIDDTTGYLPELVIKGNKTTPEFGGGLCQIGTTTFRAVLASGLPVTQRQNHSYRVPYYERDGDGNTIGPGKDATIYDPTPDFRFVNDTGTTILITTAIKGDKLAFTFWGKRDGRTANQTDAKVSNIVPPPPSKLIETTDLPIGQKKCTEKAHPGSDAIFTYTVTYRDGTLKKKDFASKYRPWGEVCLIGVAPGTPGAIGTVTAPGVATPPTPAPTSSDTAGATGN